MTIKDIDKLDRLTLEVYLKKSLAKNKRDSDKLKDIECGLNKLIKTLRDNNIKVGWQTIQSSKDKWFAKK